jgi:hypothetical protein
MTFLIRRHCDERFRWFHSGDLQDENHLLNSCTIARHTADVRNYSTALATAWQALERLAQRSFMFMVKYDPDRRERRWTCWISWPVENDPILKYDCARHDAETPAHAICMVAIAAVTTAPSCPASPCL